MALLKAAFLLHTNQLSIYILCFGVIRQAADADDKKKGGGASSGSVDDSAKDMTNQQKRRRLALSSAKQDTTEAMKATVFEKIVSDRAGVGPAHS